MTTIYEPVGVDDDELCHPLADDDFETFRVLIDGTPRSDTWRPVDVELVHVDQGRKLRAYDSPWLGGHALVFRPRAVELIGDYLRKYGELLPLRCEEANLFVFNPTRIIDALNEGASVAQRFPNGRIMWISQYAFRPAAIENVDIFKIPNLRASPTLLNERFVDTWTRAGLNGLEFTKVWTG